MNKQELTLKIKYKAYELGFARIGIAPADDFSEYEEEFRSRIDDYQFLVGDAIDPLKGSRPKTVMPEGKSIVALVWDYSKTIYPEKLVQSFGRAYLSRTYLPKENSEHGARLRVFTDYMESLGLHIAPGLHMPERNACARAGITNYGKNNFAYAEGCGSYIILRAFLVDQELVYDEPTVECGCPPNCHLCIDSCPTGALYAPGKLKPEKCLLYNQMRGTYNMEVRDKAGMSIHGCDICQAVCPRNKKVAAQANRRDHFLELLAEDFDLEKVLLLTPDYYEKVIYPIAYNYIHKLELFQRNAAIALGNTGDQAHVPALMQALETCKPRVQGAAAWALGKIGGKEAEAALKRQLMQENTDERTKAEILHALEMCAVKAF
ncbi:MAG TPA: PBS lyase [Lachnospiraceae bacterium]|nr:PBS lyase [Lachnospiraceae bacterium]